MLNLECKEIDARDDKQNRKKQTAVLTQVRSDWTYRNFYFINSLQCYV